MNLSFAVPLPEGLTSEHMQLYLDMLWEFSRQVSKSFFGRLSSPENSHLQCFLENALPYIQEAVCRASPILAECVRQGTPMNTTLIVQAATQWTFSQFSSDMCLCLFSDAREEMDELLSKESLVSGNESTGFLP